MTVGESATPGSIDDNFDAYENAEMVSQLDFSHLTEDDFADIQYDDEDGTPYGMVQGVPVAINTQPPAAPRPAAPPDTGYDKVGSDIGRGLLTGQRDAGRAFQDTAAMVAGAPIDLMNEGLKYLGLGSDYPIGGSESIRDALASVVNFGNSLIPDEAIAAGESFAAEKPQSPIIQSIVNEITKFGINAVSPALALRAFTVMTPFARSVAWGGIADFINAQPDDESAIATLAQFISGAEEKDRSAFANATLLVLQRNSDDSEFINKARVALDGMVIGGAIEKTLEGAGYVVRAVKSGALRQAIVDAGAGADQRLSGMRDTLSANPVSGGVDVALSAAGKLAGRQPAPEVHRVAKEAKKYLDDTWGASEEPNRWPLDLSTNREGGHSAYLRGPFGEIRISDHPGNPNFITSNANMVNPSLVDVKSMIDRAMDARNKSILEGNALLDEWEAPRRALSKKSGEGWEDDFLDVRKATSKENYQARKAVFLEKHGMNDNEFKALLKPRPNRVYQKQYQRRVGLSAAGKLALKMAPEGSRGHKMPHNLLVEGSGEKAVTPVTQAFNVNNKAANFAAIDQLKQANPDALKSPENWLKMEAEAFGGQYLPVPPMQAINYANDPARMAEKLRNLSPEMKAGVDEGFKNVQAIKALYDTGAADEEMTANLFVWGILSRGAGPVQQESAYIDIITDAAPLIKKVLDGTFDDAARKTWEKDMRKLLPPGSPARQVTMNVNAAGKLLQALSVIPEGGDATVLRSVHDMIGDPNASAASIRRKFMELTDKAGIDNKVVSFILLVAGRDDVLVMDRIQSRHLWDDGRFKGANIYDGFMKEGTTAAEGLHGIMRGPRGLFITEALEDGLRGNVAEAYKMVGREQDASLGRFHWETWVIDGEQVVDHSTLQAVATKDVIGQGVTEGKPGTFSSGARYMRGSAGPVVKYPLSDGSSVYMKPETQKKFEAFIKREKNGIIPKGFKVTERKDIPWYERPEVDRNALDAAARKFADADADGATKAGAAESGKGADTAK